MPVSAPVLSAHSADDEVLVVAINVAQPTIKCD
jgi:hypothetical protein